MSESVQFNTETLDLTVQGEIEIHIVAIKGGSVEVKVTLVETATLQPLYLFNTVYMSEDSTLVLPGIISTLTTKFR